ncbi:hypothetical protein PAHAL_9G244900 [Panicum hallii]|uniref:Alpha-ketoglutarate-dependent dioxygenase AlkB-like domain-containing protein n=1 Tax=Panicum hallii TaxID=206008 RepID=A0A2S3IM04_9POAL|nr:hypothetical protein PAHAL_9G244900 [Panicum hallii]
MSPTSSPSPSSPSSSTTFTRRRRPSGDPSRTGGCRTGEEWCMRKGSCRRPINELLGPVKMESNGSGSHECGATNESDPASSSLVLMPCSLLIFKDQAYTDYLHGIQDNELHNLDKVMNLSRCPELKHLSPDSIQGIMDEQHGTFRRTATRVSLTCRLVLKVHKKLFKI